MRDGDIPYGKSKTYSESDRITAGRPEGVLIGRLAVGYHPIRSKKLNKRYGVLLTCS